MKKILLSIVTLVICFFAEAQKNGLAEKYARTITQEDLFDYLNILASDALEGRETGERGQKLAAAFISDHFNRIGLKAPVKNGSMTSYYQNVPLLSTSLESASITLKKKVYANGEKMIYVGTGSASSSLVSAQVVFAGKGTEGSYEGLDVKGKVVLLFSEDRHSRSAAIGRIAASKGAVATVMIRKSTDELLEEYIAEFKEYFSRETMTLKPETSYEQYIGIFYVTPSLLPEIIGKSIEKLTQAINEFEDGNKLAFKKIKAGKIGLSVNKKVKNISSENVLGFLEGSDLKDEILVITSHYDHLGKDGDKIYNGADDDGSGTAGVMDVAQAFVKAKEDGNGPRRSILFMTFTGEEKGLLGSEYYTSNPVFPLESTITDLNMDMIGRNDADNYKGTDYVCLVGSDKLSTELHEISEKANKDYTNLELNYVYNDVNHPENIYYRSDHWNFAKNGIPVIFYTTGSHPDYHKETDTVEKIEKEVYLKRTHLVFYTAWELTNRDKRPTVDVAP